MTTLSDGTIRLGVAEGWLGIEPFNSNNVQPASYDVTLGNSLIVRYPPCRFTTAGFINPNFTKVTIGPGGGAPKNWWIPAPNMILPPWSVGLVATEETFQIPNNIVARVEGRSTIGREALFICITAGLIDPGFSGTVTLELFNATDNYMQLVPGYRIAQVTFEYLDKPSEKSYNGAYNGQKLPQPSRMDLDR